MQTNSINLQKSYYNSRNNRNTEDFEDIDYRDNASKFKLLVIINTDKDKYYKSCTSPIVTEYSSYSKDEIDY